MEQNQSFSIESMLKCCDVKRGGEGVKINVNIIMTLIFPQGLWTRTLTGIKNKIIVADPPSFVTEGPTERYVLLGEPLSLVCGTGLNSNPQASVTWMAPGETTAIVDDAKYDLENGPEIVRLNFTNTIMEDNGLWKCVVTVTSGRYIVISGNLVFQDQANIGSITRNIQLTVIGELWFL